MAFNGSLMPGTSLEVSSSRKKIRIKGRQAVIPVEVDTLLPSPLISIAYFSSFTGRILAQATIAAIDTTEPATTASSGPIVKERIISGMRKAREATRDMMPTPFRAAMDLPVTITIRIGQRIVKGDSCRAV